MFTSEKEDARVVTELGKTTFEGFKRFAFDEKFIEEQVKRTWEDSRALIHQNKLEWEYVLDKDGQRQKTIVAHTKVLQIFRKVQDMMCFLEAEQMIRVTRLKQNV